MQTDEKIAARKLQAKQAREAARRRRSFT